MHQHSNQTLPSSLSALFDKVSNIYSCNTLSVVQYNLYLKFSTNRCQNSFQYQGVKIWNSIPCDFTNRQINPIVNLNLITKRSFLTAGYKFGETYNKQSAHIQTSWLILHFFKIYFPTLPVIPASLMTDCLTRRP